MKTTIIICLATLCFGSCTKLNEEVYDEHIKRPQIDTEVAPSQWETIPKNDNDIKLELKE